MLSPRGHNFDLGLKALASASKLSPRPRPRGFGLGLASISLSYYVNTVSDLQTLEGLILWRLQLL